MIHILACQLFSEARVWLIQREQNLCLAYNITAHRAILEILGKTNEAMALEDQLMSMKNNNNLSVIRSRSL